MDACSSPAPQRKRRGGRGELECGPDAAQTAKSVRARSGSPRAADPVQHRRATRHAGSAPACRHDTGGSPGRVAPRSPWMDPPDSPDPALREASMASGPARVKGPAALVPAEACRAAGLCSARQRPTPEADGYSAATGANFHPRLFAMVRVHDHDLKDGWGT